MGMVRAIGAYQHSLQMVISFLGTYTQYSVAMVLPIITTSCVLVYEHCFVEWATFYAAGGNLQGDAENHTYQLISCVLEIYHNSDHRYYATDGRSLAGIRHRHRCRGGSHVLSS